MPKIFCKTQLESRRFRALCYSETSKARFKRRTLHVPNLMQMRKIYCFRSFALDSAHEKFDVRTGPQA